MNRQALRALIAAVALLAAPAAHAVPMSPRPVQLKNADGTVVQVRMRGDEFLSWAEDLEGYTLAYDRSTGAWQYAREGTDGSLRPSALRPGVANPRQLGLKRQLRPGRAEIDRAQRRRLAAFPPGNVKAAQTSGNVQALVLFVKFNCPLPPPPGQDCLSSTMATTFQPADFNGVYNGVSGSVKDYYRTNSGQKLNLTAGFAGTVTPGVGEWITLKHNDAHYAHNSQVNNSPSDMVVDAVEYLNSKQFNFAPYDSDGDGVIDVVSVVHVGPGYETNPDARLIHSHRATMLPVSTWDGKQIVAYHTVPEVNSGKITPVGVIAHESGHDFGLPDLYDTTYESSGLGRWSIMAEGSWGGPNGDSTVPSHFDAWSKKTLGWVTPRIINTTTNGLTLHPVETTGEVLMLGNGMPPSQYFLFEVRQAAGWDQYLPGAGLAVYHVDETKADNDDKTHYLVALEEADSNWALTLKPGETGANSGEASDLYPLATPLKNSFTPSTTPGSLGYGIASSQISVTNITRVGVDVSFDVAIVPTGQLELGFTCFAGSECKSNFCVDGVCCDKACIGGICDACSRALGSSTDGKCENTTVPCNDNNPCTDKDACSQGACLGTPRTCPELGTCFETSVCDTKTGSCTRVQKPDKTPCDDGNDCTAQDECTSGNCLGLPITECPPPNQCHKPVACANGKCGTFAQLPDYTDCDDGSKCTLNDACLRGQCVGNLVKCPVPNDCYELNACDPATGACPAAVMKAENSACDDKTVCTKDDKCNAGQCKGVVDPTVTTCPAPDQCHEAGVCSATGACVAQPKSDGTTCDDNDKCTRNDKCQAGVCTGVPLNCGTPPNACSTYTCVPESGQCVLVPKTEGATCSSGNPCNLNETCQGGKCLGEAKVCAPVDECHLSGTCNPLSGKCSTSELAPDGKKCTGGSCQKGVCVPMPPDAGEPGPDASTVVAGPDAGSTTEPEEKKGCGCGVPGADPLVLFGLLALVPLRRRRG